LTNFPRALARSIAPFCHPEPCRAADLGNDAYHGPCPDKGEPPHRYTFTVYALSVEKLDVPPDSSGAMVVSTAKEHLLGKAAFVAHYGR